MGGSSSQLTAGLTPSGLVVAGLGFFLTRFTVTLVATDDPLRFLLGGVLPLALGLSVAAYGVALTVGDFESGYVRTTALWCVAGTLGMGLFVGLTLYGAAPNAASRMVDLGSETYLSNLLIGGCAGGTVTGVFAARNRRRRLEQSAHAKRMVVLNHVFRDAVLNALTAIRGHVRLLDHEDAATRERAVEVIDDQSVRLEESVEEIRHLARGKTDPDQGLVPVALDERLRTCVDDARERFPEADVAIEGDLPPVSVRADELVGRVFELLVENAVIHSDAATPRVRIACERDGGVARVSIADNGPGLPAPKQAMLAEGTIEEFEDPSTGFGLNVATLLAESYRGDLDATVTDAGTTIEVTLPLAGEERRRTDAAESMARTDGETGTDAAGDAVTTTPGATPTVGGTQGVSKGRLIVAAGASVVAGVVMGLLFTAMGGSVPVIGALYGVPHPVVGWLTHVFHSVVFGLLYLVVLVAAPGRLGRTPRGRVGLGIAWGIVLWLVAAGVVMPLWLRLVGVSAALPNLALPSLVGHVAWGLSLGAVYSVALAPDAPTVSREGEPALDGR